MNHHKPALPGPLLFEAQAGGADPAEVTAAGNRIATLLVRGPRTQDDATLRDRVVHLADTEGLGAIAELWSPAPADSLAGALWRLYVLRTWVHRNPAQAAREFAAGKAYAPVREAVAGVADPPSPDDVTALVDTVLAGVVGDHFDVTLARASAFAHIVGVGRGQLDSGDALSAAKLVDTASELHLCAEMERQGHLT